MTYQGKSGWTPAVNLEKISDESDDLRWFALDAIPDPADDVLRRLATVSREAFARHG